MSILRVLLLLALVASASDLRAARSVEDEYKALLLKTARIVHQHYVEEVHPDSLVQAAARGIFNALDPASEYTFKAQFDSEGSAKQLNHRLYTLMQMAQAIDENALYPVAADTLIRFGIAGMMEILDPYSVFLEKRNLDNFNIQTQGKYGGLGFRIQVVYPDSAIAVWALLHDQTPAALAGVKSGDLITAINNTSTKGMSASVAADSMRGEPGTAVTLTLKRADRPTPFDLTIERQEVQVNSVSLATLFPGYTGYIKLDSFQKGSSREMFNALVELEEQGMERLIFDLRNNGGGYLEEAVQIADLFLPRDHLVVFTAGRAFKDTSKYFTREDALLGDDTPLIVLVNRLSASASEIVSGTIQDWDRGLVLGTTTVGKGSVQQVVPIDDRAELKLTMAAWHTPSGRSIDKRMRKDSTLVRGYDKEFKTLRLERIVRGGGGIAPDIEVAGRSGSRLYGQLWGFYNLNNQFFYYAREHRLNYPNLTPDFVVGPADLAAFRAFAENRGFNYISELEAQVEELDQVAEDEEEDLLAQPLSHLIDEIDKIEEKHWQENEERVAWRLTFDILEKAFGEQAAEAYSVTVDPQVLEARRIIADPDEYQMWFDKREIGVREEDSIAQEGSNGDLQ